MLRGHQGGAPRSKIIQSSYNSGFIGSIHKNYRGGKYDPKKSSFRVGEFELKIWEFEIYTQRAKWAILAFLGVTKMALGVPESKI